MPQPYPPRQPEFISNGLKPGCPIFAAALKLHPDLPLRILPGTVRPEYYAFAMRADEPLRHEINVTIARILDRDAWTRVRFDYLGEEAEKH